MSKIVGSTEKSAEPMGLSSAIKQFFNYPDNPSLMADYKKLSQQDKEEIKAGLEANGYNIKPLINAAA